MDKLVTDFMFPVGGIDRSKAFSDQDSQTAYDTLNVLPQDVYLGRVRGGSRPGMLRHSTNLFGQGNPIRMVSVVVTSQGLNQLVCSTGDRFYNQAVLWSPSTAQYSLADSWYATATTWPVAGRLCKAYINDSIVIARRASIVGEAFNPFIYTAGDTTGSALNNPPADPLGDVPLGCAVAANIGNRLVLAGDYTDRRSYYMSRVGDPHDFAYGDTDEERAVTGELAIPGANNDGIKAIVPWYADYSLWFCGSSTALLIGDNPTTGAYFYPISDRLGCLDSMAWCRGPGQTVFVMTRDGLAKCDPSNPRGEPELVSRERIPKELQAIGTDYEVTLIWDSRAKGVHIFKSKVSAVSGIDHWFWYQPGDSYFRMRYPTDCEPFSACALPSLDTEMASIILGCRDGRLRQFSIDAFDDDGTNFDSHVILGPTRPGNSEDMDGKLLEVVGVMADDSSDVDYYVLCGDTHEQAVQATPEWTGSFSAGRNRVDRPRTRSGSVAIKVSGVPGDPWSMEKVHAVMAPGGRQRT